MGLNNTFRNLKVKKIAQDISLSIYPEDAKAIQGYIDYKQKALGGDLLLADLFQCLVRYLWLDPDFAKAVPNIEAETAVRPRKSRAKKAR